MAASGNPGVQEGAQLLARPPHRGVGRVAARAVRGAHLLGQEVPEHVAQPLLCHFGHGELAGQPSVLLPEVGWLDVAGLARAGWREVDDPELVAHLPDGLLPGPGQTARVQFLQRAHGPACRRQGLERPQRPPRVLLVLGVGEQPPLELRLHQRLHALEVDLPDAQRRQDLRAPEPEGPLAGVTDGDLQPAILAGLDPVAWEDGPAWPSVFSVSRLRVLAEPERGLGQVIAAPGQAAAVGLAGLLARRPRVEVRFVSGLHAAVLALPAVEVPDAQPGRIRACRAAAAADPAGLRRYPDR